MLEEQLPHPINSSKGKLPSLGLQECVPQNSNISLPGELCKHSELVAENSLRLEPPDSSACPKQENPFGEVLLSRRTPWRTSARPPLPLPLLRPQALLPWTPNSELESVFINILHFRRCKCPSAPAEIRAN